MANVVVVGAQWGDEGKGKIVDWLSEQADIVVRFQGGHNAGHTLVINGNTYKLALLPSGVLRPSKLAVIGNGVVFDPQAFLDEVERLKGQGGRGAELAQALYDAVIEDMEASLRQLGAGDAGVGKRVRVMTEALQGRVVAYEAALAGNPLDVEGAIRRNLYGTVEPDLEAVRTVAYYLRQAKDLADRQPLDRIMRGIFEFPPAPVGLSGGQTQSY